MRVGMGFDVHPFATDDRPLVLGGIRFEGCGLAVAGDMLSHAMTRLHRAPCGLRQ